MKTRHASSHDETPIFFPAGGEELFGILTSPTARARDVGVIFIYGGAYNMSAHVNQMWLRCARALSDNGFYSLRYDYRGIGESSGKAGVFDHRSPHTDDLRGAIGVMTGLGIERLLLVGDCLGARASLVCASEVEGIESLLMLVPMVRDATKGKDEEWAAQYGIGHYLRRAIQPRTWTRLADPTVRRSYGRVVSAKLKYLRTRRTRDKHAEESSDGDRWVSDMFLGLFEQALGNGITIDILFGEKDDDRRGDFDDACNGRLGAMIDGAGSQVTISTVSGSVAGITDLQAQDEIVDYVRNWAPSRLRSY